MHRPEFAVAMDRDLIAVLGCEWFDGLDDIVDSNQEIYQMVFETLKVSKEGAVLFVEIAAPPMNLLEPELDDRPR
jgi:hypothetical protein